MLIFLSEYLTCGAVAADHPLFAALAVEGTAMLRALAADAARVTGWQIVVTWSAVLGPLDVPGVEVRLAHSPEDERLLFEQLTRDADKTLVIAPESGGLLESRCRIVNDCGGRFVGPTASAIALTGDKLALAEHLERHNVPTIDTRACDFPQLSLAVRAGRSGPLIVKPRHGAGAVDTFRVTNRDELNVARSAYRIGKTNDEPIVQPFIPGTSLSVAAIVSSRGTELFPVARQRITGQNRLHYAGGSISTGTRRDDSVLETARQALEAVPGLSGYVGIDLLLPVEDGDHPVVVEINPRLTSSYHGYRALTDENLAARVIMPDDEHPPIRWARGHVEYDTAGRASA